MRLVPRAALTGAAVAAALCAIPTTVMVHGLAKHGYGEGLGAGVTFIAFLYLPGVWVVALVIGAGLGALVGFVLSWRAKRAGDSTRSSVPPWPPAVATRAGTEEPPPGRSAWSRWWDRGQRKTVAKVLGALLILPAATIASFGYIAFEWKRTEVQAARHRALDPSGSRAAAGFSYRWGFTRASHHHDVRVSRSGANPARGRVVWKSSEVGITRVEWKGRDSLLVHVDLHNDEYVPWLTSTIQERPMRDLGVRTVVHLTPDFLMVTNPKRPDDLHVHARDIRLSGLPASVGDSIRIDVTVFNAGLRPARGVEVEFSDESIGVGIGERVVDIPAGGRTAVDILWVPAPPDSHRIAVYVSPYVFPQEEDYENNAARISLVLGDSAATPISRASRR